MSTLTFPVVVADAGLTVEADRGPDPPVALNHAPHHVEDGNQAHLDHPLIDLDLPHEGNGMSQGQAKKRLPVNHAHYLRIVQMHLAHDHLEDNVDERHAHPPLVAAEALLDIEIEEDGLVHDQDLAQGQDHLEEDGAMVKDTTIVEDLRHNPHQIAETDELMSSEIGQPVTILA